MKKYSVENLTIDDVRELLANGDDKYDNQIRVDKAGFVYLSQDVVGAVDIDDLAFRFESFDAGNDYVGEDASKDSVFVERIYKALKGNWPNPKSTYIDDFNIEGMY